MARVRQAAPLLEAQLNKQTYVEKMQGMFMTPGWRECWKPRLEQLREGQQDACCYAGSWEEHLAARHALNLLDAILMIEDGVKALEERLVETPAEGADVVDLQKVAL